MIKRRILVGHAPIRTGPGRPVAVPHRVAVLPWRAPFPLLSVIVKATATYRGEGPHRRAVYIPGAGFRISQPTADEDKPTTNDFVANKKLCDVLVTGHLQMVPLPSGEVPVRHAAIRVGENVFSFAVASSGAGRVPMRPPYIQSSGATETRVGPRATFDGAEVGDSHEEGFDYGQYQAAHPALQVEDVPSGSDLVLEGLSDSEPKLVVALPSFFARAVIDYAQATESRDMELFLDTLAIDLDDESIELTFRGFAPIAEVWRTDVDRIVTGFASDADWEEADTDDSRIAILLRELPWGTHSNAWERDDVLEQKEPPPLREEELEMARYDALDCEYAPQPTLTLEQHAQIAVELAEEREPRAAVLAKHDLDEYQWGLEERALGEQLQAFPQGEQEPAQDEYARHFRAAQDAKKRPEEDQITAKDYAELKVRMEVENPRDVMKEAALSLGMWMRIDRRFADRAALDRGLAQEIEAHLTREREARGERQEVVVDELGQVVT